MLAAFAWATPPLVRWLLSEAVWQAENRAACTAAGTGVDAAHTLRYRLEQAKRGASPRQEDMGDAAPDPYMS